MSSEKIRTEDDKTVIRFHYVCSECGKESSYLTQCRGEARIDIKLDKRLCFQTGNRIIPKDVRSDLIEPFQFNKP